MIKVNRSALIEIATHYILANTPYSLLEVLNHCETVEKLKNECGLGYLVNYYRKITSRGERTEISMGLAYAVLLSILTHKDFNTFNVPPDFDVTRLNWGIQMQDFLKSKVTSENVFSTTHQTSSLNLYQDGGN